MASRVNEYLGHDLSDESGFESGYDSDAAEISKSARLSSTARPPKRRKLSHSRQEESDDVLQGEGYPAEDDVRVVSQGNGNSDAKEEEDELVNESATNTLSSSHTPPQFRTSASSVTAHSQTKVVKKVKKEKDLTPGVIYLSSLPPYLKPSALRNMLEQRGFGPIKRIFLAPLSKAKAGSKKNSRQLYAEGWIEFASKKKARVCAEALNASPVGGKKSGFYHDDLWNMKYLKGMAWEELMAGIREERREEEGRRDEERRTIARETKVFIEGVEEGKRVQGIKKKRKVKDPNAGDGLNDVKRTWRQFEVTGSGTQMKPQRDGESGPDVDRIVSKIF